jgi:hypothetical protein
MFDESARATMVSARVAREEPQYRQATPLGLLHKVFFPATSTTTLHVPQRSDEHLALSVSAGCWSVRPDRIMRRANIAMHLQLRVATACSTTTLEVHWRSLSLHGLVQLEIDAVDVPRRSQARTQLHARK